MSDELQQKLSIVRAEIDAIDAQLIELLNRRAKCAQQVGEIKASHGDAGYIYRPEREAQVIADLASARRRVVATGGGAVLRPENRQNLQGSGLVIYLDVPLQTLCERTRNDKNRPLLQVSDPLSKLKELYEQRDPLYRSIADLVVSGPRITAPSVLQLLLKAMGEPCKR